MKQIKIFALAALLLGGLGLFSSCSKTDKPFDPVDPEEKENRDALLTHIGNDSKTLADNFNAETFNATTQAYAQLLALIKRDAKFVPGMRTLFSAVSEKKSLLNIYPVSTGSELAKMGYLLYINVDNSGFGAQVVFDGKGGCRILGADHLEFIFPATITGIGTTLFKLNVKNSADCYQSVADVNIPNVKRVACVSRLPKSITMTLTGFIANQELTLSENTIRLELPQKENSDYVSFDAGSFKLIGSQSAYLNATDASALDYSLAVDGDQMTLDYGYANNGMNVINSQAVMTLPQKENFLSQMSKNTFDVANLKAFTVRVLDDLTLTGTIADGADNAQFAQYFANNIKNRQQTASAETLASAVETLNASCLLQLFCEHMTKPETVKFCVVQNGDKYMIEPALKDLRSDAYLPISALLDQKTLAYINQPLQQSFTPAGNASSSALEFYAVFMQMMPLSGITK
jgi:hypothetical protein